VESDQVVSATEYKANFLKQLDITFQNNFVGIGNGGAMKVNGTQYNLPHASFPVLESNTIQAEAYPQIINGIVYRFTQWNDGNTSSSRTFNPGDHQTNTANYVGKPLSVSNTLWQTASVGQYVRIEWQDNVNANIPYYRVWRKVRQGSTVIYGPSEVATVNKGVQAWTDHLFLVSNSSNDRSLEYDVRPYYSVEGTFSDPDFMQVSFGGEIVVGGGGTGKIAITGNEKPLSFSMRAYPNPFNPSTKISFDLPEDGNVTLAIYDVLGRKVNDLASGFMQAGAYSGVWDANNNVGVSLSGGIYFARLSVSDAQGKVKFNKVNKLMLVK
jgi:hypothetical protein